MPGVAQISSGDFNINLSNGDTFAKCTPQNSHIYSGTGTVLTCKIVLDMASYSSLSGTLDLPISFLGGGRTDLVSFANQWKVGANTVTFNGNLKGSVTFAAVNPSNSDPYQSSLVNYYGQQYQYYLSPKDMCNGGAVKQGTFTFNIQTSVDGAGILLKDQTQYHVSSNANLDAFLYPTAYSNLNVLSQSYSANGKKVTISFGSIPAGERFWFSTFYSTDNILTQEKSYNVNSNLQVTCANGAVYTKPNTLTYHAIQLNPSGGGSGNSK